MFKSKIVKTAQEYFEISGNYVCSFDTRIRPKKIVVLPSQAKKREGWTVVFFFFFFFFLILNVRMNWRCWVEIYATPKHIKDIY